MNYCIECNKEIPNRNKNCSILCQKKYQYKEYIQNWKNGVQSGMRGNYLNNKEENIMKKNNKGELV